MRILVTGAGALLGQGIMQSLLKSKLPNLEVIAADPNPLSAGLYWTDERYILPMAADPNFVPAFCKLIECSEPDLIIPGTDVELMMMSVNRELIEKKYNVKILVSDPRVIGIGDDKYKTYKFFVENGFCPPDSCLPGEESYLLERVGFPLIVKPRTGARSLGVRKVNSRAELNEAISNTENPIVQECIGSDSNEYTAGVVCFDNECCASIVMRRDLRDGNTYRAFVVSDELLNGQIVAFAKKLKPFGPANFQFRITDGQARVFEINSRFSGTTPLRMYAGFNEVEMCVRHILFGENITQPIIKPITILRHWSETIVTEDSPAPLVVE